MITKQQQLEWLAKEFGSLPFDGDSILMSDEVLGSMGYEHRITNQELKLERDKMSSKPEVDNSWHERGELPPVGTECEVLNNELYNPAWEKCTIIYMSTYKCIYSAESRSEMVGNVDLTGAIEFRPLRTEREKAIDAACKAIGDVMGGRLIIERLYDAGMLK